MLLIAYESPNQLDKAIADFIDYCNYHRYHKALDNMTLPDVFMARESRPCNAGRRCKYKQSNVTETITRTSGSLLMPSNHAKVFGLKSVSFRWLPTVKPEDVKKGIDKGKPVGEVIKKLWSKYRYYGGKGENFGKALAEWAANHSCPEEKIDKDGDRRINSILFWLLRGQQSEYWGTTVHFKVDDNGKLVEI